MNPPNQILQEKVQQMPNSQLLPNQVLQNITWASAPAKNHDDVTALNVTQKEEILENRACITLLAIITQPSQPPLLLV